MAHYRLVFSALLSVALYLLFFKGFSYAVGRIVVSPRTGDWLLISWGNELLLWRLPCNISNGRAQARHCAPACMLRQFGYDIALVELLSTSFQESFDGVRSRCCRVHPIILWIIFSIVKIERQCTLFKRLLAQILTDFQHKISQEIFWRKTFHKIQLYIKMNKKAEKTSWRWRFFHLDADICEGRVQQLVGESE